MCRKRRRTKRLILPKGKWLRYRRVPTWRVWLCLVLLAAGILFPFFKFSHGWLSLHDPVEDADYYLVEGWMPDYALLEGCRWMEESRGKLMITSGGPLDRGFYLSQYHDFATLAASNLAAAGFPAEKILPVPAGAAQRDRTLTMATAVKDKLSQLAIPADRKRINIVSLGAHARRSKNTYQAVLGPDWKVGVICVADADFPRDDWWKHSAGLKKTVAELVAIVANRTGAD
jgi:hypothetical protein